jgi:hypothetical protein
LSDPSTTTYEHSRTAKVFHQVSQKISGRIAIAAVLGFFLAGCLLTASQQFSDLFSLRDVAFTDSYIFYDVLHFQKTGVIYRDLSLPPYLPAVYSPMVYVFYSIPGRIGHFQTPFFGPRLMVLAAFLFCVLIVISIARSLIPRRSTWWWALLLACSIGVMRDWILQLRGDFPGILFDLLAIRLLFGRSRRDVLLAGLCAGFATQFKITYVAALVAGSLWLLALRRWKDFGSFAAAGILSSLGIYLFWWAHEPRMLQQMTALSPGIADFFGLLKIICRVAGEPVIMLAALSISPVALRAGQRWALLFLFGLTSLSIASLTDIQAGGSYNYFFEFLFAAVPAAVLGVTRVMAWSERRIGTALFIAALFLFSLLAPMVKDFVDTTLAVDSPLRVKSRNQTFLKLEAALSGRHIFSTIPRIALLDAQPALLEPYGLSYMLRLGKFDPAPILQQIRDREFDVVITAPQPDAWRGIPFIAPDLRHAITASYQPFCVHLGWYFSLPSNRQDGGALERSLTEIGCKPVVCDQLSACLPW